MSWLSGLVKTVGKVASFGGGLPGIAGSVASGSNPISDLARNSKIAGQILPGAMTGGAAGGGGALKTIGSLIDPALGILGMYQGNQASNKANKFNDRALGAQEQQYQDYQPIGAAGRAGLMDRSRRDLSSVFGGTQNPFANPAGAAPSAYNPSQMGQMPTVGSAGPPPEMLPQPPMPMSQGGGKLQQAVRRLRTV